MIAAEILCGALERFVEDALSTDESNADKVSKAMEIFEINKLIIVYVLTGLGYICQLRLQKWWDGDETEKGNVIFAFRWLLSPPVAYVSHPMVMFEKRVLAKMLTSLRSGVEALEEALKDLHAVSERSMSFNLQKDAQSYQDYADTLDPEKAEKKTVVAGKGDDLVLAEADKAEKADPDDIILQYAKIECLDKEKEGLQTQLQELQEQFQIAQQDWTAKSKKQEEDWQAKLKQREEELASLQGTIDVRENSMKSGAGCATVCGI